MSELFCSSALTVRRTVSSCMVRCSSSVCAGLEASGRFMVVVLVVVEGAESLGSALGPQVFGGPFAVSIWGVGIGTGLSPVVLPFLMVLFECGDLVIKVSSGEELRGGVTEGPIGASGERGRRCPRGRATIGGGGLPRISRW